MFTQHDITIPRITSLQLTDELPEFYALKTVIENNGSHDHDAVFDHCVRSAEQLPAILNQVPESGRKKLEQKIGGIARGDLLFLATLFHDIGKLVVPVDTAGTFLGHEQAGARLLQDIVLLRSALAAEAQAHIVLLVEQHGLLHLIAKDVVQREALLVEARRQQGDILLELTILALADTAGSDLARLDPERCRLKMSFFQKLLV